MPKDIVKISFGILTNYSKNMIVKVMIGRQPKDNKCTTKRAMKKTNAQYFLKDIIHFHPILPYYSFLDWGYSFDNLIMN